MDVLTGYASSDSEGVSSCAFSPSGVPPSGVPPSGVPPSGVPPSGAGMPPSGAPPSGVILAPAIPVSSALILPSSTKILPLAPLGPDLPSHLRQRPMGTAGDIEKNVVYDDAAFETQRKRLLKEGVGLDLDGNAVDVNAGLSYWGAEAVERHARLSSDRDRLRSAPKRRRSRPALISSEGPDRDASAHGIWAPPDAETDHWAAGAVTDAAAGVLTAEQSAERDHVLAARERRGRERTEEEEEAEDARLAERRVAHLLPPVAGTAAAGAPAETSFHGEEAVDYRGRDWTAPPAGYRAGNAPQECYVPKKCTYRFTGHQKGVHVVRLYPKTGHLLLSGSLDGEVRCWKTYGDRRLMRKYMGHSAGVRDVAFDIKGERFLSASFDRSIRLWDTSSGNVLSTFGNRKVPYSLAFYPKDDDYFVVGCSDNRAITYRISTGEITQEYNHHLAPVNTVTFTEGGRRLVTTSDDKKVLVWEWDVGAPIKYISEPGMHAVPSVTLHPNGKFWLGTSLDNAIVVYAAEDRYNIQRKKRFRGHQVAGFACQVAVSPNGRLVASGDGNGKVYFWDWNSSKQYRKFKAHDKGPTIGCVWHPLEPSIVFTCGWDGVIKMWE